MPTDFDIERLTQHNMAPPHGRRCINPPEWWPALAALPAVRLRCALKPPGRTPLPTAGELRGAIGHRLMALDDASPLACFFPSSRAMAEPVFLGHASPWALHLDAQGRLEVAVFADGLQHFVPLVSALLAAVRGRVGRCEGLALGKFEHQHELVDGPWKDGLPQQPGVWRLPAQPVGLLKLSLHSPLRLRRDGHALAPQHVSLRDLAAPLMRRASSLLRQAGLAMPGWDAKALLEAMPATPLTSARFEGLRVARYSQRQGQSMQLHGVVGDAWLGQDEAAPLWPLWWMGQGLHVGKTPCLGMGRYALTAQHAGH